MRDRHRDRDRPAAPDPAPRRPLRRQVRAPSAPRAAHRTPSAPGAALLAPAALLVVALVALGPGGPAHAQPAETGAVPPPALFDVAWDDLSDVLEDLHPAFVPEAATHADAPIYHLDYRLLSPAEVEGRIEIRVVNRASEPWDALWFHLHPNLIGGTLEVTDVAVGDAAVAPAFEQGGAQMRLPLAEPLAPGGAALVRMALRLEIPSGEQRNYSLLAFREGIVSLAHAYPILAVYRDDAGWDLDPPAPYGDLVFAEASWFRARIRAPADLVLVATGAERAGPVEADAGPQGERTRLWEVRAGPVRDLYVSLGDFRTAIGRVAGTEVRSHYLEGDARAAGVALDHATRSLEILGSRWTPYPYRSFDMVPLATEALGVEFPGVIALAEQLYEDAAGDLSWVVVHEVAHQWFYGTVGNDQVTHPWLDEAMAQYAVLVYARERYGEDEAQGVRTSFVQRWRSIDEDVPIGLPVGAYTASEYGSVVYGRGPLVIDEIARTVGPDAFDTFVRGFAAAFRWRNASPEAFRAGAEAACGCPLGDLFEDAILPPARSAP